ncbi:MAG: hypothetical protein WAN39_12800, partial [Candidatus Cybelea sp.]
MDSVIASRLPAAVGPAATRSTRPVKAAPAAVRPAARGSVSAIVTTPAVPAAKAVPNSAAERAAEGD